MRLLKRSRRQRGDSGRRILIPESLRNDHARSLAQRCRCHVRSARDLPSGAVEAHTRHAKRRAAIEQHVGQHQRGGKEPATFRLHLIGVRDGQATDLTRTRHAVQNRTKRPLQLIGALIKQWIAIENLILPAHLTTA